jgi:dipeptidyl-peptidase 4
MFLLFQTYRAFRPKFIAIILLGFSLFSFPGISFAPNVSFAHEETTEAANAATLSLDEIYALPNMIGTAPTSPVWSRDNSQLAFLWNDKGRGFRDVWVYNVQTGNKEQITTHDPDGEAAELDEGVSQVIWLDGEAGSLAYTLNGRLFGFDNRGSRQIEADLSSVGSLSLSPNGEILAFIAGGNLMIRAADINHNEPASMLVEFDNPGKFIRSFEWASDSGSLVFQTMDISEVAERDIHYYANQDIQVDHVTRAFPGEKTATFNIGQVDVLDSHVQYFERPNDMDDMWGYGLSDDGNRLFINSSDDLAKHHTIYMYDVASGEREVFYYEYDARHLRPDWRAQWAPGDDGLIILTDFEGYLHLYHQKTAGGEPRALTAGEWEIASFKVDTKRNQIYFIANKSALPEQLLYRVSMSGSGSNGDVEMVSLATPGTHEPIYSPDMGMVASIFSTNEIPRDLYTIDLSVKETTRVTSSPLASFYEQPWGSIRFVNFRSHVDGVPLIGRMSLPRNFDENKRYPLIVGSVYSDSVRNQFGGRIYHPTWGLDQYLTSIGYIVLNVNVRGSWGQGREHNQGLYHGYGIVDINDLQSGVKYLVAEGLVDENRVGIWGSSYGGLMTMMSLFKKPGVYAAGIAGAPATNVRHAYPGQMWVMGRPSGDDQPERYSAQSAMDHTSGLEDPLMIIHGSRDQVVLYSDTIEVVERLIADEKMFELVTLPGSVHGWDAVGSVQRRFAYKKMVEFFNRYLHPEQ